MEKTTKSETPVELQEGQLIHLDPNCINPHPAIAYLEEHGIFPIGSADMDKMAESVVDRGFLQPIVVTPNSDGTYHRIIGRRRTETAKKLGTSIPCYIRHFSSDEDIIDAWKTENFVRAQYSLLQQINETEKIHQIWSKRTAYRVRASQKCVPELQYLIEKNVFQMRSDADLITAFTALPIEIQQAIAAGVNNSKVTITEHKNVIRDIIKDPELQQQIQDRDNNIATLQSEVDSLKKKLIASEQMSTELKINQDRLRDVLAQHGDNNAEVKRLQDVHEHNEKVLKNDIKAKEKLIAELERKNRESLQEMADKVHNVLQEQATHVFMLIHRLSKDVKNTAGLINDDVAALECKAPVKEHLLIMKDSLDKARSAILKELDATELLISDRLVAIEALPSDGSNI